MKRTFLVLAAAATFALSACQTPTASEAPTPFSVASSVTATLPNSALAIAASGDGIDRGGVLASADMRGFLDASKESEALVADARSWQRADADLIAFLDAHADAPWIRQVALSSTHALLARHFATPTLTDAQATAAARHVDRLLAYEGIRSEALNATVLALRPHWDAARYQSAVATVAAALDAPCETCQRGATTPTEREAQTRYDRRFAASVATLQQTAAVL